MLLVPPSFSECRLSHVLFLPNHSLIFIIHAQKLYQHINGRYVGIFERYERIAAEIYSQITLCCHLFLEMESRQFIPRKHRVSENRAKAASKRVQSQACLGMPSGRRLCKLAWVCRA